MKLAWYVLKEHIAPFFYSLLLITFLFLIQFLVQILDNILSKGLNLWVVLEIVILNLAWMVALSIPMAVLVATLMAFGRLAADNEITAMKAGGISPFKAMLPVQLVALSLCLGLIWFNNYILPDANHRAAALKSDITRKRPEALIQPRTLIKDFEDHRIWIERLDKNSGVMTGISIYQFEKGKPVRLIYADTGRIAYAEGGKKLLIHLRSGTNHAIDDKNENNYIRVHFRQQTISIDNVDASLTRHERSYRSDREMSVQDMYHEVLASRNRKEDIYHEYREKVFDDMRGQALVLKSDTLWSDFQAGKEEEWWGDTAPGESIFGKVIQQEKDKKYFVGRCQRKVEYEERQESMYLVEIHKKFSIPVACLVFVLIGAPLGVMARRGGIGAGSIYSIVFFLLYWVCLLRGETMADNLTIRPWLAMWAPNIIVGCIGLFLVIRMAKENYLNNEGPLGRFWLFVKRIFSKKNPIKKDVSRPKPANNSALSSEDSPPENFELK